MHVTITIVLAIYKSELAKHCWRWLQGDIIIVFSYNCTASLSNCCKSLSKVCKSNIPAHKFTMQSCGKSL